MGIFLKKTRNLKNKKTLNLKKSHKITQNVSYHYFKSIKKSLIPFERICKCILNGGFWQNPSFPRPLWNCAFSIRKKLIDKLFLNNTHSLKSAHLFGTGSRKKWKVCSTAWTGHFTEVSVMWIIHHPDEGDNNICVN